jgi:hypothetical protein
MTSNDLRCPQCSAHVSPGADWCTLCFADLRVPPVVEVVEVVEAEPEVEPAPVLEPAGEQVGEPTESGRGKHARSATLPEETLREETLYDPTSHDVSSYTEATTYAARTPRDGPESAALEARANEMLAILAAQSSHPMGPLADRLESTSARVVAGIVGLVVLSVAGLLVMTVLGHFV